MKKNLIETLHTITAKLTIKRHCKNRVSKKLVMQRQNNYLGAAFAITETMLNWKLEET